MGKFKIIFLSVLGMLDIAILIITIGYLVIGIKTPNSLGGRNLQFTGSYILFFVYLIVFIAITIVFVILLIKWLNKAKKIKTDKN